MLSSVTSLRNLPVAEAGRAQCWERKKLSREAAATFGVHVIWSDLKILQYSRKHSAANSTPWHQTDLGLKSRTST